MITSLYWDAMNLVNREPAAAVLVVPRAIATANILLGFGATRNEKKILLSIGHHESRFLTYAVHPDGDCGPTQIRNPELWGSSCAAIFADPAEGYRVSLIMLRYAAKHCPGTWQHTLTLYVSGKCGTAPSKAWEICSPVGLCETKTWVLDETLLAEAA